MGLENMYGAIGINTRVSGKHALGTAKAAISLPSEISMLESTVGERLRATGNTAGQTAILTLVSFTTVKKRVKVIG